MSGQMNEMRGMIVVALAFLGVWLFPAFVIEGMANLGAPIPGTGHVDMWPATLGMPGLVGGVLFAGVVAAVARGRSFDGLSPVLLGGLGALVGVGLGGIFLWIGWIGGESLAGELAFAIGMSAIGGLAAAVALRLAARRVERVGA